VEVLSRQPTIPGPTDWFTGGVWIDGFTTGAEPDRLNVAAVHFMPGARTAWHSHDGGQHLYVTEGSGLVQSRGDRIVEIRPGDVVYTPDGEEHWHGAAPDHFMTHLSLTRAAARWGEHVTEDEYLGRA